MKKASKPSSRKQPDKPLSLEQAREQYLEARRNLRAVILSKYDATEPNRFRRQPERETSNEGEIYDMTKRLHGCNLGRDLERNYSPAKSMMHQIRMNVVGELGKVRINTEDGGEATAWLNEVFAKDCDFRDDLHLSSLFQNILAAEVREGDALLVFDDGLVENSGKILTWEADQVAPVSEKILKEKGYPEAKQDNGIIRDNWGRVLAFCSTGKRGLPVIDDPKDVTIWKRENAILARNPWRLNQGRGVPSLITPSTNFVDLYEILACELMSAKKTSKQYAFVKRENAVTDWDTPANNPEYLPENDGRTAADVAADGANQTTHTAANYERLEAFTGGLMDYLESGDTVQFPELDHPNPSLKDFLETVICYSGSALGLARAYSMLRADSSYTSFRGDMIMTWVTFYWLQKHLERTAADWIARKALTWAQAQKSIGLKPLAPGWERKISWTWPTMPSVDELKESTAVAQRLKNGTTDFAELLGPDWEKRFESLSTQLQAARKLGLPLSIFEQKSGGMAASGTDDNKQQQEE